jgi:hypothetical protein
MPLGGSLLYLARPDILAWIVKPKTTQDPFLHYFLNVGKNLVLCSIIVIQIARVNRLHVVLPL